MGWLVEQCAYWLDGLVRLAGPLEALVKVYRNFPLPDIKVEAGVAEWRMGAGTSLLSGNAVIDYT